MKWAIPTRFSVYALVLLLGASGCQRGSTDESAIGTLSESGPEETVASSADTTNMRSVASETPSDAASTTDAPSDGVDRPASNLKPVPAHVALPEGAVVLMSLPLGSDKHLVQAQYPNTKDSPGLLAKFKDGLAEHGWTPEGEAVGGGGGSLTQVFERENEILSVSSYSKPDKLGLFVQVELRSK